MHYRVPSDIVDYVAQEITVRLLQKLIAKWRIHHSTTTVKKPEPVGALANEPVVLSNL